MTTVEQKIMRDRNRARSMMITGYPTQQIHEESVTDAMVDMLHLLQEVLADNPDWPDPRMGVVALLEDSIGHYLTESFAGATEPEANEDGLGGFTNPPVFIDTVMDPTTEARR